MRFTFLHICAAVAFTGLSAHRQPAPQGSAGADLKPPILKVKFHQDFRGGDPNNPNLRFVRDGHIGWEPEGARITMPSGQGKIPTTGVAAQFRIKGDFEITTTFEILKAEKPTEGYGVGVSIYAAIDSDAGNAVSLARRVGNKGGVNFLSDRMTPNPAKGQPDHYVRTKPSKASIGKLRVQRAGSMVRFLYSDGEKADFAPIYQDNKKCLEIEFGAGEIRYFQIGGDAGDSEAALDARLLDLTVEAEELPGLAEAPKAVTPVQPPNPQGAPAPGASANGFPMLGIVGASASVLAVVVGLGIYLLRRRVGAGAATGAAAKVDASPAAAAAATISFACPECGSKLVVKAGAAGRRLKCPRCSHVVVVPKAEPADDEQDE
jgi:predicted Zn finger-like uncharacterized protein